MAKKILSKFFPSAEQVRESTSVQYLGKLLHDPNLWHLNRHSVAGAFAVGLFVSYIPIPLQIVQAALLAVWFRVNLPIAVSLIFVTNPLTIPPMFYIAYRVGAFVLGIAPQPFDFQFDLDWIFLELGITLETISFRLFYYGLHQQFDGLLRSKAIVANSSRATNKRT